MSDDSKANKTASSQPQQILYPYGLPYGYPGPGWVYVGAPEVKVEEKVKAEDKAEQAAPVWYGPNPAYIPHPWVHNHPHAHPGYAAQVEAPNVETETAQKASNGFLGIDIHNDALVKGVVIGAGLTYLLTNETVQKNLIGAAVRLWSTLQGGVEEVKERFRDAEADLHASEDHR